MANRLKERLHELVDVKQTGFVKGRQITYGFVYAQQVLHHSRKAKIPISIFKVDIKKAFDTLCWDFLLRILSKLGCPMEFVKTVQKGILQGSSQILINGLLGKRIILKREVRQGDPLSPLLFIIAMDFLGRWMDRLVSTGAIRLPFMDMKPCLFYVCDNLC